MLLLAEPEVIGVAEPEWHPLLGQPQMAAQLGPVGGEMKIRSHRDVEVVILGPLAEIGPLLGALLGQGDLHGIATSRLEGDQQPLDPLGGEIVTAGVGQHRQPDAA